MDPTSVPVVKSDYTQTLGFLSSIRRICASCFTSRAPRPIGAECKLLHCKEECWGQAGPRLAALLRGFRIRRRDASHLACDIATRSVGDDMGGEHWKHPPGGVGSARAAAFAKADAGIAIRQRVPRERAGGVPGCATTRGVDDAGSFVHRRRTQGESKFHQDRKSTRL